MLIGEHFPQHYQGNPYTHAFTRRTYMDCGRHPMGKALYFPSLNLPWCDSPDPEGGGDALARADPGRCPARQGGDRPIPAANSDDRVGRAGRNPRLSRLPQVRAPDADGRVQGARRRQSDRLAHAGRAWARCHRRLHRQPCPVGRLRRATLRCAGDHPYARGCQPAEGRRHPRARRGGGAGGPRLRCRAPDRRGTRRARGGALHSAAVCWAPPRSRGRSIRRSG
jgi:hypothetical protein